MISRNEVLSSEGDVETLPTDNAMKGPPADTFTVDDHDPANRDWIPTCWSSEARAIEGAFRFGERVKPWNWLELDAHEADKLWSLLLGFVAFFNQRYGMRIDRQIPPCWAEHGPIVEELTTLMFARWHAFESPHGSIGGAQYWHSYTLPAFYDRIRDWLGDDLLACQQGRHRERDESALNMRHSWAIRSEVIAIMDVNLRTKQADDNDTEDALPHGVEIPFLSELADSRTIGRSVPNTLAKHSSSSFSAAQRDV